MPSLATLASSDEISLLPRETRGIARGIPDGVAFVLKHLWAKPLRLVAMVALVTVATAGGTIARGVALGFAGTHTQAGLGQNAYLFAATAATVEGSHLAPELMPELVAAVGPHCRQSPAGPLCSPEVLMRTPITVPNAAISPGRGLIRGVTPVAIAMRPTIKVVAGREIRAANEVMVGALAASQAGLPESAFREGNLLRILDREWKIVGRFEAPGHPVESEVWLPANVLADRRGFTHLMVRLSDPQATAPLDVQSGNRVVGGAVSQLLAAHPHWGLKAEREDVYYSAKRWQAAVGHGAAWVVAVLLVAGAAVGLAADRRMVMHERRAQHSTLLTLGIEPARLEWEVFAETAVVTALGMLLGMSVAVAANGWPVQHSFGAFRVAIQGSAVLFGLGVGGLAGLIGWLVAWPFFPRRNPS